MIHRIKLLLALVQELGMELVPETLQRLLFLFCREYIEHNHYYEFLMLGSGPHSLQAEADMGYLVHKNYLVQRDGGIAPIEGKKRLATDLDFFEKIGIQKLKNAWAGKSAGEIASYVADRYPALPMAQPEGSAFFTIGYEGRSPEAYINLLSENGVKLLCDVRRNPLSKKFGFSKSELAKNLPLVGIAYLHMPELGIASEERQSLYTDADYNALFHRYEETTLANRQDKLGELQQLIGQHGRIAITCFEADVNHCHRGRVARAMPHVPAFEAKIAHL